MMTRLAYNLLMLKRLLLVEQWQGLLGCYFSNRVTGAVITVVVIMNDIIVTSVL